MIRLKFFIDTTKGKGFPTHAPPLVEIPYRDFFRYCINRITMGAYFGGYFRVPYERNYDPTRDMDDHAPRKKETLWASANDVVAVPNKTNAWFEVLLCLIVCQITIFVVDRHLEFNRNLIALGLSFLLGLFWGEGEVLKQKQQAKAFNRSKGIEAAPDN